ncbi:MAG: HNH endonuclease signature motif containing protein [Bacteroidota bacterium]
MAKQRIKIPKKTDDEVMAKSLGKCYCGKHGDQIHHIDSDPSNNDFDNLVLLCFDHHHDASLKNGLKKQLSHSQLKQRRNEFYKQNEKKKDIELKHYSNSLKKISEENLFRASLDAGIVLEIIKINSEFFAISDWKKRQEILSKLDIFSEHSSLRISNEIFKFCDELSNHTRVGMPVDISDNIFSLIMTYFPYLNNIKEKKVITEMAEKCANIALGIVYDAFIYLGNMAVACSGLEILKYLYLRGKELKIETLKEMVLNQYNELEGHLNRPERTDLETAKSLLKLFKNDLDNRGLDYPEGMKGEMFRLIEEHRKVANQRIK